MLGPNENNNRKQEQTLTQSAGAYDSGKTGGIDLAKEKMPSIDRPKEQKELADKAAGVKPTPPVEGLKVKDQKKPDDK